MFPIPWRLVALAGLLAALAGLFWYVWGQGYSSGEQSIQAKWDKAKQESAEALRQAQEDARRKERELQSSMDKLRRDKDAESRKIAADLQRIIDGLRDRPERPAVPATPSHDGSPQACTGAELYRQDAEFLAREAERADQLRIALQGCQALYETARRKLAASP